MAHWLVNDYVADILVRDIYRGKYGQHLMLEGAVKISNHIVVAAKIGDIKAIYHYRLRTVIWVSMPIDGSSESMSSSPSGLTTHTSASI